MRQLRSILPALPHHVVLRGNNRRRLFSYRWEYRLFLKLLEDAARAHVVPVHALALMTNHVHLVVSPPEQEVCSAFVKSFAQRYAQKRNQRRAASGKLFEQRYASFPLRSDAQLAKATAYIELNPVSAGMFADPLGSPWTTYALHLGRPSETRVPQTLWSPSPWYLALGDTDEKRQARYADWVADCRALTRLPMPDERDDEPVKDRRIRRPDNSRAT